MSFLNDFTEFMVSADWVVRDSGSYNESGEWEPGIPITTPIRMIEPQPLREQDLNMLEDGERASDFRKTWIKTIWEIKTREDNRDADTIEYGRFVFKVHRVETREGFGKFQQVILRNVNGA